MSALTVGYDRPLFAPVDFKIHRGEVWSLFGRNGSGKTTLMRTLLGLHSPLSGVIEREDIRIAYVPQRSSIDESVPSRVIDLLESGGFRGKGFWPWTKREDIQPIVERLGLAPLLKEKFQSLSVGQKQRVLLGRALVSQPELLFLDEPTSAMDIKAQSGFYKILESLAKDEGKSIVIISHDADRSVEISTHAIFVDAVEAIAHAGDIEEVMRDPAFIRLFGALYAMLPEGRKSDPKTNISVTNAP